MEGFFWTRRQILGGLGAGAGTLVMGGCAGDGDGVQFNHGVASGDPLHNRVIIWTRITPVPPAPDRITVRWSMASDRAFTDIVAGGQVETSASRDFTVKVDAGDLMPGTIYYYRFQAAGIQSPIGRTRTLPVGDVSRLRIAAVSCSNYTHGFFNVYRDISGRRDIDLVLHLGDYIYEYPDGVYATEEAQARGRHVTPAGELLNLKDYRARYAHYKTDPDLQAVHAAHPFIVVWDDHESANNAWSGGAENHDEGEGDWRDRRDAAIQAFREWIPIRDVDPDNSGRIYRSFDVGNLATLIMLDTRIAGRDRQISYQQDMIYRSAPFDFSDPNQPVAITDPERLAQLAPSAVRRIPVPFDIRGAEPEPILDYDRIASLDPSALPDGIMYLPDAERFRDEILYDPDRTILGEVQAEWIHRQLAASKDRGVPWQVIGQQILMGKLVPPDLTDEIDPDRPTTLSERQQALFAVLSRLGLPFGLDAWDGYWAARERLFEHARTDAENLVVLTGDSHNAWAFNLMTADGSGHVGVELATASVSSPGLERYVPVEPETVAAAFVAHNPELEFLDAMNRGYVVVEFTPDYARADFQFVDTVLEREYESYVGKSFRIPAGERRLMQSE